MPQDNSSDKEFNKNPAEYLENQARSVLENAIHAEERGVEVYQSLRNLNEVIGTEYGDRVLYELIQNAHDAHGSGNNGLGDNESGGNGRIAVKLVVHSENGGVLYIANGGDGFKKKDVDAICNLAMSAKEVGEGIGNKGLGFRSIEALTNDVRIFSCKGVQSKKAFDGYCFRFARTTEIENLLHSLGCDREQAKEIAGTVPRYLIPRPLKRQPEEITAFARRGYATVIVAPLHTPEAVELASREVEALANLDVPLLLFLERIMDFRIDIEQPKQKPYRRHLSRQQETLREVPSLPNTRIDKVSVGRGRHFLVVRRELDEERVLNSVEQSIPDAPQLERWLKWKGTPVVSVAVGLSKSEVETGRLYNFLPMGKEAGSPFIGYLDAPFFTNIDRRNANLNIPLNQMLTEAAAEACAAATLSIVEHDISIPAQAQVVFDLFSWTGEHAKKLDDALVSAGSSLGEASVIPVIAPKGKKAWSNLSEVNIWPQGSFSLLKDKEVAKHVGAKLVSSELNSERIERLEEVAQRVYLTLTPSGETLAEWSEGFAHSLKERKMAPSTWSKFYKDLPFLFHAYDADLANLNGKLIFYVQESKLRAAGGHGKEGRSGVFISDIPKGKRKKAGIRLLPAALSRRYQFLDSKIKLEPDTLHTFTEYDLIREYNSIEALTGLKSALGENANEKQRLLALDWAFQVWRATDIKIDDKLLEADLHVPTLSGWHPAEQAAFSSSWGTRNGKILEDYLTEAAKLSKDCKEARDLLLISQEKWPIEILNAKRDWNRFLEIIGVTDGLRPVKARLMCKGLGGRWNEILRNGEPTEALDTDWCAEYKAAKKDFRGHCRPQTEYTMKGHAWRIPGQMEHDSLSKKAREGLCALIFEHLRAYDTSYFLFEIGRFDLPYKSQQDRKELPTPLATFLRSKAWISVTTQDGDAFRPPSQCWAAREGRNRLPRFVDRVLESVANLSKESKLAELAFSNDGLGLRNWQDETTAIDRLQDLANASVKLNSNDRSVWRDEYRNAWLDVIKKELSLPDDVKLVVKRRDQFATLEGRPDDPEVIIVTDEAQKSETLALSVTDRPVLEMELDPDKADQVAELLERTTVYKSQRLDGDILVDETPFTPRVNDPLLLSLGLDWLPEIIAIGHEILRRNGTERNIQGTSIEKRIREIRVRHCRTAMLVVEGEEIPLIDESQGCYAFSHDELPTLILSNNFRLNWKTLAKIWPHEISRLVDPRILSSERLLTALAYELATTGRDPDGLDVPNDQDLATVLRCDIGRVSEIRAGLRSDREYIQHLLVPVVAYYGGLDLGEQLRSDFDREGAKFSVYRWLKLHLPGGSGQYPPKKLIDVCKKAANRLDLYKKLNMDYEEFNYILLAMEEPPLSNENEAELRRLYYTHLQLMREKIIERLRRYHVTDFRNGNELALYTDRKNLKFLKFNENWILTKETLDHEVVKVYISKLLTEALGDDVPEELEPLEQVLEENLKTVREFAKKAMPIVRAWHLHNGVSLPASWEDEPQVVARQIENSGLLDFQVVRPDEIPKLCLRAGCWPEQMPLTIDEGELGLNENDIEEEAKRRKDARGQQDVDHPVYQFAGETLDTGDPDFPVRYMELVNGYQAKDETWSAGSQHDTRLVEFERPSSSVRDTGNKGEVKGKNQVTQTSSSDQQQDVGWAGEYLAFQFLRRRYSFVDESCWISKNRARSCGGDEGDDTKGFDFQVNTPQATLLYEVKSSLEDSGEFELTANEIRVASNATKDDRQHYRILYVPYVFSPDKWLGKRDPVQDLPNPMLEKTRNRFKEVGRGSVRFRFERQ